MTLFIIFLFFKKHIVFFYYKIKNFYDIIMPPKKNGKGKKTYKRKYKKKIKKQVGSFIHRFQRYAVNPTGIWMSGATPAITEYPLAFDFQLGDIQGINDFTNLYDQYRINSIEIKCRWVPPVNTTTSQQTLCPRLWYAIDFDDANTPTLAELKERSNCKCINLKADKNFYSIKFSPKVLTMLYNTAVSTAYATRKTKHLRIDISNINLPHFGIKFVAEANAPLVNFGNVEFDIVYNFDMFNAK